MLGAGGKKEKLQININYKKYKSKKQKNIKSRDKETKARMEIRFNRQIFKRGNGRRENILKEWKD